MTHPGGTVGAGVAIADGVDDDRQRGVAVTRSEALGPAVAAVRVLGQTAAGLGSARSGDGAIADRGSKPANGVSVVKLGAEDDRLAALQAQQDQRDAIVAHSMDVVMFFRADHTIEWVSPSARRLFGVEPSDLVGRNGIDLVHPQDQERCIRDVSAMPGLGDHARTQFRYRNPDGRVQWVDQVATNLLDDPNVGYVVGNLRDITELKRSEERVAFQGRLLDAVGQAVVAVDMGQRIIYWNEAATRLYGWTSVEAVGRSTDDLMPATERWGSEASTVGRALATDGVWTGEMVVTRKDGTRIPVQVTNTPLYDDGTWTATVSVSSDLSDKARLLERVDQDHRRLQNAQRTARLGSFEFDLETGVRTWSDELYRILGVDADTEPSMEAVLERIHPDDLAQYLVHRQEALSGAAAVDQPSLGRILRPDGTIRWVEVRAAPGTEGSSVVAGTLLDVTERKLAEDELAFRAGHDALTGLPNRAAVMRTIDSALADARLDAAGSVGVAFIDLDRFKSVNDSLGHNAGDRVLVEMARRLTHNLGPDDVVGRFGGDEFSVIRTHCADRHDLEQFASRIRSVVEVPVVVGQSTFVLTASVGATLSHAGNTAAEVLHDADTAMYHAKATGRNRVELFDAALHESTQRRLDLALELGQAIERCELRLVYQPIVLLTSARTVGFEALLRWDHPRLGAVSPAEFIPIAEESGLIVAIGDWVFEEAIGQLVAWRESDPTMSECWMSINVSAKQLEQPDMVEFVSAAVDASGVHPALVHLEVTESMLMGDVESSIAALDALRSLGLHISVDDFGTGYSSLSYLKHLPIDTLKIDRSFVSGLGRDLQDRSIAEAIIALSRSLGLEVLAEGIETPAQAAALVEMGCTLGQGYFWSRPLPPAEAALWARSSPPASAPTAAGTAALASTG